MIEGLTDSEKFVNSISKRAFLSLWTHPNPIGKKGKELCDCLIICGNHIIIISVKDIEYKDTEDEAGWKRWIKAAIEKSASQIWGAERWLNSAVEFTRHDERTVELPPKENRIIHRISVSLGAKRKIMGKYGDLGHGIVHVCDEFSLGAVFGLLDTITDFVEFLAEVELLISRSNIACFGGIEDLLAIYLLNNYSFPYEQANLFVIDDTIYAKFVDSDDYKAIQESYKTSYFWDELIEHFVADLLTDGIFDYSTDQVTDNQLALIQMALQPRRFRAVLTDSYLEFLQNPQLKILSRVVGGYQNTAFVFHLGPTSNRNDRVQELGLRCLVVRGRLPKVKIVIGISRDKPDPSEVIGCSHDLVYVEVPNWDEKLEQQVTTIQKEFGYFKNVSWTRKPENV